MIGSEIKLSDIENLKPSYNNFLGVDFCLSVFSEFLLLDRGFQPEGNDFYWMIKDFFSEEADQKAFQEKLLKVEELDEISRFFPSFDASLGDFDDSEKYAAFLESTTWKYANGQNEFSFKGHKFSWKSAFIKQVEKNGKVYFAYYRDFGKDGVAWHIQTPNEAGDGMLETTEPAAPYDFGQKATAVDSLGNRKLINKSDFFSSCDTLRRLDNEQKKAVSSPIETNSLILAGAGSGKTRCIVSRVAYLNLVKGIPLKKIALLTFTNNAANELKKRSKELFDDACDGMGIEAVEGCIEARTIDSFIYRLAKTHFRELGMSQEPRFSNNIGSNKDVLSLLTRIIRQENKESIFQRYINQEDGSLSVYLVQDLSKFFCGMEVSVPGIDTLAYSYLNYELDHSLFLDFSSLTYAFSYASAKPDSALKKEMAEDYDAILIDEFQDVSIIQNKVFEPLYDGSIHFSFVGDDDQTIYGWRGSDIEVINRISHLSNTKQFNLTMNYRSNISIVEAGNAILTKILGRAKRIPSKAMNDTPEKIVVSTYDEKFAQIMPEIDKLHESGVDFDKILFLTKTNDEAKGIQAALDSHGVPTVIHNDDVELDWVYWLMTSIMKIMAGYPTVAPAKTIKSILFSKENDYTEQYIAEIVLGKNDGGEAASKLVALRQTLADGRNKTLSEAIERYQYTFTRLFNDFSTTTCLTYSARLPRICRCLGQFKRLD